MMRFAFIRSGSKGNATLIKSDNALIQIDMGITLKLLKEGCLLFGKTPHDIDAVFFTHNHSDHIKNHHMMRKFCPIYASRYTIKDPDHLIEHGVGEEIKDLVVIPVSTSHDAPDPFNFLIVNGEERLAYITDTGRLFEEDLFFFQNCDYYLIESNHDVDMEIHSRRPIYLKRRILGDYGHLSNIDSAHYMAEMIGGKTKGIYLGHLSEECNEAELALQTHKDVYDERGIDYSHIDLRCTSQEEIILGGDKE